MRGDGAQRHRRARGHDVQRHADRIVRGRQKQGHHPERHGRNLAVETKNLRLGDVIWYSTPLRRQYHQEIWRGFVTAACGWCFVNAIGLMQHWALCTSN